MGDTERIVLDIDDAPQRAAINRANKSLDDYESRATKAQERVQSGWDRSGETVVRVSDRSRQAIDRMIASAEKKAAFAGLGGADRLGAERDQLIRRLGGEVQAIDRVRAAYDKLIAVEKNSAVERSRLADAIRDPMTAAKTAVDGLFGSFGKAGLVIGAAAAAATVAGKAWFDMAERQMKAAEATINLADRTGLTINQVDKLQAMGRIANVSVETLETSARTLSAALDDTTGTGSRAQKALDKLGVSAYNSAGEQRALGVVTLEVIEKLSRMENETTRVALATKILGRGAQELQPLIKNYAALDETARKLGYGTREGLIKALGEADDKTDTLRESWNILEGRLAKPITAVIQFIVKGTNSNRDPRIPLVWDLEGRETREVERLFRGQVAGQTKIGQISATDRDAASRGKLGILPSDLRAFNRASIESDPTERLRALGEGLAEARKQAFAGVPGKREEYEVTKLQIKALEKQIEKQKELETYREKGLKYVHALQAALARGGLAGTPWEVKPVQIEAVDRLDERTKYFADKMLAGREFQNQTLQMENDTAERRLQAERVFIDRERDERLAALSGTHAITVQQQITVEEKRFQIVKDYLGKEAVLQVEAVERQKERDLGYLDWMGTVYPERAEDIAARRSAIITAAGQKGAELEQQWINGTSKARGEMEATQRQIQYDAWRRHFDGLKRGFEGLFDAALSGGRGFSSALKQIFFSVFLTPVKEQMANFAAGLFAGGGRAGAMAGGGSFGGILGTFGMGGFGGGSGGGMFPGGTPPFWGGPGGGSSGGFGGFGGMFSGGKNWLSTLGNLGYGPKGGDFGGEVAGSYRGVGGLKGGAMLAGGGILAYDGLRRGGMIGLAETTAGGALIGAKFGGPLGAAIGAGIGAAAGLVRLFIHGAEDKLIQKVKDRYAITIDKAFAKTLLEQARSFGSVDLFLGTQQARDLIWLYGESTGQRRGISDDRARGVELAQSGGSLYQAGTYVGGQGYGYGSSLPSLGSLKTFAPAQQVINVTIQADGDSTAAFLEGKTVQFIGANGRAVQAASNAATSQSAGRQAAAINLYDPLAATI